MQPSSVARRLPLYLALLLLTQCSKCKNDPTPNDPAGQLPPATQTGANTFGCLVNGQPYTPAGNNGSSNYAVSYDRALGGTFDLTTYRYQRSDANTYQSISLLATRLFSPKTYSLKDSTNTRARFNSRATGCEFGSQQAGIYCNGTLTITRLDLQAGIISGTFDFTLAKRGCDTVRVTQGRFDKRL